MAKPKEPTVLVVVDMQPRYIEQNRKRSKIIKKVAHLIRGAKRDKVPVIFLELFPKNGKTYLELTAIIGRYKKCRIQEKTRAGGSKQVFRACKELKINPKHFVVCGVYFIGCVKETVIGLHTIFQDARISVVKNATDYLPGDTEYYDLREHFHRVKLIDL